MMLRARMRMTLVLLAIGMFAGALRAQDLVGNWQGTLEAGKGLRTVIKVTKDDGKLKGVMYSVDQGGQPLPMTSIGLDGKAVSFGIKMLDVSYAGTLNPDGNSISGSATQNGQTHTLNLVRVNAETMWAIPNLRSRCRRTRSRSSTW